MCGLKQRVGISSIKVYDLMHRIRMFSSDMELQISLTGIIRPIRIFFWCSNLIGVLQSTFDLSCFQQYLVEELQMKQNSLSGSRMPKRTALSEEELRRLIEDDHDEDLSSDSDGDPKDKDWVPDKDGSSSDSDGGNS